MDDNEICARASAHVASLLHELETRDERAEAIFSLLHLTYELTRGIEGDEYMRLWLEAALDDLAGEPAHIMLRELQ